MAVAVVGVVRVAGAAIVARERVIISGGHSVLEVLYWGVGVNLVVYTVAY